MPESARKPRATTSRAATPVAIRRSGDARTSIWHRIGRTTLFVVAGVAPWFFLPFTSAPALSSRFLLVAIAATVGLVALLADTVERRRLMYPGSLVSLGVLAVVVTTAISALFSETVSHSVFGGLLAPDSLAAVVIAALLFVLTSVFMTERKDLINLVAAFVGGAGLACVLGFLGFLGVPHLARYTSSSISELGFLAVLTLGIACLVPLAKLGSKAQGIMLAAGVFALGVLVFMNFAILWVAVALIALFAAASGFMRKTSITVPLGLSLIALLFVLLGSHLPSVSQTNLELRPSFGMTLTSVRQTLTSSEALVGTGPATYAYSYMADRAADSNNSPFWSVRFEQGASYLATVPVTTGILGVLAWLVLLIGAVLLMRRRFATDPAAPYAVLATLLAGAGLLVYVGSFTELIVGALALGALVGIAGERRSLAFPDRASWPLFATFLALVVVTGASLAGLYLVGQRYVAAAYYTCGTNALSENRLEDGIAKIERAVSLDTSSDTHLRGLSQALLLQIQQMTAATTTETDGRQAQAALERVVLVARQATEVNPADPMNWSNLGGVYEGLTPYIDGIGQEALTAYTEAESRDPKNPMWSLSRARTYVAMAGFAARQGAPTSDLYAQAQAELTKALELKPDYVEARFLSAQTHFTAGSVDAALARVAEVRQLSANDASMAFQLGLLQYQNARYADAAFEFERAVSLNREYANARYFLGLAYTQLDRTNDALTQFRQLAESNPENQEVLKIISNLTNGRPALEGLVEPTTTTTTSTPESL